jgi:tryptophan synthase alpha chain
VSRIELVLSELKRQGRKALIPYVTSGHPSPALTVDIMHALVAGGGDIIELGVPFSDPMADGPVIQRSNEQALAAGVGLADVLGYVSAFRERDRRTPVVLMGYCNPVERMGMAEFTRRAALAGVDGVLLVDCPPEEADAFSDAATACGLDPIFLLAPTSGEARIRAVARVARGYVYYVSLKGVTGSASIDTDAVARQVPLIREATGLPVGVGFGIRDAATAARVAAFADAVVIGSRLIQLIDEGPAETAAARLQAFVAGLRAAMDDAGGVGGGGAR